MSQRGTKSTLDDKSERTPLVVAVVCVLAVIVVIFALLNRQSISPLEEDVALLEREQTAVDQLPTELLNGDSQVNPTTSRLVGQFDAHSVWVANGRSNEICLILGTQLESDRGAIAVSCAGRARFVRDGVGVSLRNGTGRQTAVFVPDGYTEALQTNFTNAITTNNLILIPNADSYFETHPRMVELPPDDGLNKSAIKLQFP